MTLFRYRIKIVDFSLLSEYFTVEAEYDQEAFEKARKKSREVKMNGVYTDEIISKIEVK